MSDKRSKAYLRHGHRWQIGVGHKKWTRKPTGYKCKGTRKRHLRTAMQIYKRYDTSNTWADYFACGMGWISPEDLLRRRLVKQ